MQTCFFGFRPRLTDRWTVMDVVTDLKDLTDRDGGRKEGWTDERKNERTNVDTFVRMDGRTDERKNGRTDGRTNGRTDEWMEGRTDGWKYGRTDRQTSGRTDERKNGRTDVQTEGRTDGRKEGQTDGRTGGRKDGWTKRKIWRTNGRTEIGTNRRTTEGGQAHAIAATLTVHTFLKCLPLDDAVEIIRFREEVQAGRLPLSSIIIA